MDGLEAFHLDGDLKSRFGCSILELIKSTDSDGTDPTVNDVVRLIARKIAANKENYVTGSVMVILFILASIYLGFRYSLLH